jgi:dolichol kinase
MFNLLTLPVTILFIGNAFCQLVYFLKLRKRFPNNQNLYDFILVFILWFAAGLLYPFIYSVDNEQLKLHQAVTMNVLCIYGPILVFFILFYQYNVVLKYSPHLRKDRTEENYFKIFDDINGPIASDKKYSIKTDLHRKFFHLLPALIIIILWKFATEIWAGPLGGSDAWGVSGPDYGTFLIITVGYGAIILFAAIDYVRLSFIFEKNIYHLFPNGLLNLVIRSLKRSELRDFAKPVGMALALMPVFFFFPFEVFAAAALLTSLGDAAASIIGISFGKRHFPRNSHKTIAGYIAGFITSFFVSNFALWILGSSMNFYKIILVSFGGAFVFLLIDILSLKIDDNILNPLLCAPVMAFLFFIL